MTILSVCVNDIVVTRDDYAQSLASMGLSNILSICSTDLGHLKYCWALRCHGLNRAYFFHNRSMCYIHSTGTLGARPMDTQLEISYKMTKDDGDPLDDPRVYQRIMGRPI